MQHLELQLPESLPLHIISVYYPTGGPGATIICKQFNVHVLATAKAAVELNHATQSLTTRKYHLLVGGSFNAAADHTDRCRNRLPGSAKSASQYNADRVRQTFLKQVNLTGLQPTQREQRPLTFYKVDASGTRTPNSRIDDILTTSLTRDGTTTIINTGTGQTDHGSIRWECP